MSSSQTAKVVVKNLPPCWTSDYLRNFLEVITPFMIKDDGIHTFKDISHTALLHLEEPVPVESVDQLKLTQQPFMDHILEMKAVDESTHTVLVHYKDPDKSIYLHIWYYLDSPNCRDRFPVEDVQMYTEALVVVVRFSHAEGAEKVLSKQIHHIEKQGRHIPVELEPFYAEFHSSLLQEMCAAAPVKQTHQGQQSTGCPGFSCEKPLVLPQLQTPVSVTKSDDKACQHSSGLPHGKPQQTTQEPDSNSYTLNCQCQEKITSEDVNKLDLNKEFSLYSDRALVINGLHRMGINPFCALFSKSLGKVGDVQENVYSLRGIELPAKCPLPHCRFQSRKNGGRDHSPHYHDSPSKQCDSDDGSDYRHISRKSSTRDQLSASCSCMVGNTKITVKPGDITTEQVDAAVSVIGRDLSPKGTAVASAFCNKCPTIAQALQNSQASGRDKGCDVRVTSSSGGTLPMTAVYHAVLNKMPRRFVPKTVKQVVHQCLTLAMFGGITSIAFPPLGVGRRFRYGRYTVAGAMMSAFQEFLKANPNSFQTISVIVADPKVIRRFAKVLKQTFGGITAIFTPPPPAESDNDDSSASENNDSDVDLKTVEEDLPKMTLSPFTALMSTEQNQATAEVVDSLIKLLKTTFLWKTTVYGAIVTKLNKLEAAILMKISGAAVENDVHLSLHEGGLRLCGMEKSVLLMLKMIHLEVIRQQNKKAIDRRKRLGLPINTKQIPSYWEIWQKVKDPTMLVEEAWLAWSERENKLNSVTSEERTAVVKLVESTWESQKAGAGKDARNLTHTAVKVKDVKRLENPKVWMEYCHRREQMFRRLEREVDPSKACCTPVENITNSSGQLKTTANIDTGSPLNCDIYPQVNEHYLFHGTKQEVLSKIFEQGLDFQKAKRRAMLGKGVYTAESSTKADQYTDPKRARSASDQDLTMILVRVLLGEPFVQKEKSPAKFNKPPCMSCSKTETCFCSESRLYDSVIDDGPRIFREFVVYKHDVCYPEYFITYNRVYEECS